MEASMLIQEQKGQFYVYLVFKLSEEVNTPLRHFLDMFETKSEANDFCEKFVSSLVNSIQGV